PSWPGGTVTTPPVICCDDVLHWAETYTGPPLHAMLCDPPYHLTEITSMQRNGSTRFGEPRTAAEKAYRRTGSRGFMGQEWDGGQLAHDPQTWKALAQHLLPGAWGMTFASSRGWHRLACAIEDAGLIMHPSIFMLGWAFGSGFPKATRIDTTVDKAAGAEREVVGLVDGGSKYDGKHRMPAARNGPYSQMKGAIVASTPATDLAKAWEGHRYGLHTLNPDFEPILVWQRPYVGKPVDCI